MKRIIFPLCAVLVSSNALAQDTNTKPQTTPPPPTPPSAQDAANLMRQTGGSLLQATMTQQAANSQAKLSDMSFFAVAEPEPKVMRKHDLVTIIVREESEYSSEGTTDLKKQADLEAKIDQFIRFSMDN